MIAATETTQGQSQTQLKRYDTNHQEERHAGYARCLWPHLDALKIGGSHIQDDEGDGNHQVHLFGKIACFDLSSALYFVWTWKGELESIW